MDENPAPSPPSAEPEFLLKLSAATPRLAATPALLAINTGMFVAMTALGVSVIGGRPEEYLRFGANFAPLTTGGEWWRLLTCLFVHLGILHFAINMWALWDNGRLVERLYGTGWFAAIYLFAGVAGGSASMLWNQQAISAGASGAVFGVLGALLAYLTVQRGSIPETILDRLRVSSSVFVTYSLFYGFAHAGSGNAANLGGLAGGFVMGLLFARPLDPQSRRNGNARRALLAALLAAVTLPTAAWLTPDTARIYRQAIALDKEVAAFNAELARLLASFQDLVTRSQSGQLGDAELVKELRANMLPAWDAAVARLARAEPDAKAPTRPDYDLLVRYATARRGMIKAVADYLETRDPVFERRVSELRAQADEALAEYRLRQRK